MKKLDVLGFSYFSSTDTLMVARSHMPKNEEDGEYNILMLAEEETAVLMFAIYTDKSIRAHRNYQISSDGFVFFVDEK